MKALKITLSLLCLFGVGSIVGFAPIPKGLKSVLPHVRYQPTRYREVVFFLPEISCKGTTKNTIDFINTQSPANISVFVVAQSQKAITYGDRFDDLAVDSVYFLGTDVALRQGLTFEGPLFAFVENKRVVKQIRINCESLATAKEKVRSFLSEPYNNDWMERAIAGKTI